ncbi:MAG: 4Fe-4S dicluster domain-containing protein [Lentisphaerae bacterium]|jgi:heterodisulfide reductase subunit C2|nr:4Fe-4S dicluster domain-containing protein [Lentisphaerota bacterium]MBT4818794.1 4Fe-4S dicluster domain-containing protein [Lentisphaerota bacterium]MBT5606292.1 4Fe-4S dicluster domain-containing protein [Lentisphaerota bacterium]MBT7059368.1 4Fe-4S dicluster domain-containing protein [Lentisphaerota bacterium]MBT7848263.1 4Fe-4S dicluster domain-containing protein [Lentisphaerota bacterium]
MEHIDGDALDPRFKHDVATHAGGENISLCFSCGTCTASCPVSNVDDEYNPRKIIRQVLLGMREEVLSSPVIWRCVLCYACYATCPQNVKFRDVMQALREMAIEEGKVRPTLSEEMLELDRELMCLHGRMVDLLVEEPAACKELLAKVADVVPEE